MAFHHYVLPDVMFFLTSKDTMDIQKDISRVLGSLPLGKSKIVFLNQSPDVALLYNTDQISPRSLGS